MEVCKTIFLQAAVFLLLESNLQVSDAAKTLVLTSEPSLLPEPFCQGPVSFTCQGTEIPIVLNWVLDGSILSTYSFSSSDSYPFNLEPRNPPFPSGVTVQVTNAALNPDVSNSIDISTVLTVANVSVLNGSLLRCEDTVNDIDSNVANIVVTNRDPPPVPAPNCTILDSSGGPQVALKWSTAFNSDHVVEKYHVVVTPDPSFCSGEEVSPSEDYNCSELQLGTNYSIRVSAINCGDREGKVDTTFLLLNAPKAPTNIVVSTKDGSIVVMWNNVPAPSLTDNCNFDHRINYTVVMEDNTMEMNEQTLLSDNCSSGVCNVTFSSLNQYCRVMVTASNTFGNSSTSLSTPAAGRLIETNLVLLVIGLLFLVLAVLLTIIIVITHKVYVIGTDCFFFRCGVGGVLIVVSVVLWVAVGFQVGLQDNTCDGNWQSARNGLIISSFVFSLLSVLVNVILIAAIGIIRNKKKKIRDTVNVMELETEPVNEYKLNAETNLNAMERLEDANQYDVPFQQQKLLPQDSSTYSSLEQFEEKKKYSKLKHALWPRKPPTQPVQLAGHPPQETPPNKQTTTPQPSVRQPSEDMSKGSSIGQATLQQHGQAPQPHLKIVTCSTMKKHYNYLKENSTMTKLDAAKWLTDDRKWPKKKQPLKVYFMNECPWKFDDKPIDSDLIMQFLSDTWCNWFTPGHANSDIRVKFQAEEDNWSELGRLSNRISKEKPTMVFNFSHMGHEEIKATIIHQFGHALGLGHVLMKPKDWNILKDYVNIEEMMKSYGAENVEEFEVQWTGKGLGEDDVNFDEDSIMQYSANLSWLNDNGRKFAESKWWSVGGIMTSSIIKDFLVQFGTLASSLKTKPSSHDSETLNKEDMTRKQPEKRAVTGTGTGMSALTDETIGTSGTPETLNPVIPEVPSSISKMEGLPCIAMRKYNEMKPHSPAVRVAEWFPEHRKWPTKDLAATDNLLVVTLLNDCLRDWKYYGERITPEIIMDILNETWKNCIIPGPKENSHIRVIFEGDSKGNWSALGSMAKSIPKSKPTMSLNFSHMNNDEIKATIIHQFGHALGLGHALMKPKQWEVLKPYLNVRAMITFYGCSSPENFEVQWTGKGLSEDDVNYDEGSVMQYSADMLWLNKKEEVPKKELGIFLKHASTLKVKPTGHDLETRTGHSLIAMEHLFSLKSKDGIEFNLTASLASAWRDIALKLGLNLDSISSTCDKDVERLNKVWILWLKYTDEIPNRQKYPPTWKGLRTLLTDSGQRVIADECFEFLKLTSQTVA